MIAEPLPLDGPLLLTPKVHADGRGFFLETYRADRHGAAGVTDTFVQDNHSRSSRGTLRGMHFQRTPGQAKLVRVASGKIWDVVVDIRPSSPTYGRWHAVELDADTHRQLYVPIGFAHGFCVLSDVADVVYKVSSLYDPATEAGFAWNDPEVGIPWPVDAPTLSPRDQAAKPLREVVPR